MSRTPLQAYQHVLVALEEGRLGAMVGGSCVYRSIGDRDDGGNRYCSVGCLFSEAQLDDISRRGLNMGAIVEWLGNEIGVKNIETVTGLSIDALTTMQVQHDCDGERLRLPLKETRRESGFCGFLELKIKELS